MLRGGRYESVQSLGELAAMALRHLVGAPRTLVYAYHRDLDLTGHARGVSSDNWRLHLGFVDLLAEQIAERLPRDALLAVVGDDGMVDLRPEQGVDLADQPELAAGVPLLAGEARARHVHAEDGAAADVLQTWQAVLGEQMWIDSREEAIEAGWFGHESWTASVPASGTWSRPRVSRSVSSNATSIRARRGWLAITVP